MSRQLFTVGPVYVAQETLQAMTKPMITHRCKEYKDLHEFMKEIGLDKQEHVKPNSVQLLYEGCESMFNSVFSLSIDDHL